MPLVPSGTDVLPSIGIGMHQLLRKKYAKDH